MFAIVASFTTKHGNLPLACLLQAQFHSFSVSPTLRRKVWWSKLVRGWHGLSRWTHLTCQCYFLYRDQIAGRCSATRCRMHGSSPAGVGHPGPCCQHGCEDTQRRTTESLSQKMLTASPNGKSTSRLKVHLRPRRKPEARRSEDCDDGPSLTPVSRAISEVLRTLQNFDLI